MFEYLKSFANVHDLDEKTLFVWLMNYNNGDTTVAKIVTDYVQKLFDKRKSSN